MASSVTVHTANPPNSACAVFVIVIMYLCTCRPWPPGRSATLSSCHCMVPPPSSGNRRQSPSGSHTPRYTPPAQVSIKKDGNRRQGKGRRVCLEGKICSIPCRTSCFASVDLKEKDEFNLFFKIDRGKIASAARNWINSVPQTDATTFAIASVSILLLWNRWTADLRIWFQRREAAGPEAGPPSRTCTRPTSAYSRHEQTHSTLLFYFSKPFRFLLKSNLIIFSTPFYFSFQNNRFHIFLFFAFEIIYSFIFFVCS